MGALRLESERTKKSGQSKLNMKTYQTKVKPKGKLQRNTIYVIFREKVKHVWHNIDKLDRNKQ
jgi:hypothetical protein